MNHQDWLITAEEQADMFPPEVVVPTQSDYFKAYCKRASFSLDDDKKPQDYYRLPPVQRELFDLDADNHDYRSEFFAKFSQPIANFFAKQTKRRIKTYGTQYGNQWFREQMGIWQYRFELVINQYADVQGVLEMHQNDHRWIDEQDIPPLNTLHTPSEAKGDTQEEEEQAYLARLKQRVAGANKLFPTLSKRLLHSKQALTAEKLKPLCYLSAAQIQRLADAVCMQMVDKIHQLTEEAIHYTHTPEGAEQVFRYIYLELIAICESYRIQAPKASKARTGSITQEEIESGLLRLSCPDFWKRKLNAMANKMREHLAIAVGMVHSNMAGYVSHERLKQYEQQRKANFEFIKSCVITNVLDEQEQHELLDIWLKSSANPKITRIELMNRMRGFEEYAEREGHEGVFVTLTAPSKYHAMLNSGQMNPKWNGYAPHQTQRVLCKTWADIRSALKNKGIQTYGFRIAEPHHDATPHFHFVLYTKPEQMREMKRIIYRYALREDGNEKGARRHRCTFKKIDRSKGSATGYVAKYVSKNIDGHAMDGLFSDETGQKIDRASLGAKAWATVWGFHQFQQIGGASVSTYRELRKLGSEKQQDEQTEIGRAICDIGDYAAYTDFQGGVFVKRQNQTLRLHYVEAGENKYKEVRQTINGIYNTYNTAFTLTRKKQWTISKKAISQEERAARKADKQQTILGQLSQEPSLMGLWTDASRSEAPHSELARPWTRVSNCAGSKNEQISDSLRQSIKKELITMRGRVTEYQIDDLLNGKPLKIYSNDEIGIYVRYSRGQLIEEKVNRNRLF